MVREYCRIARHFNAVLVKKGDINLFGFDSRRANPNQLYHYQIQIQLEWLLRQL